MIWSTILDSYALIINDYPMLTFQPGIPPVILSHQDHRGIINLTAAEAILREREEVMEDQKIRVLIAKPGLDGHDRGGKVVARGLMDAGMEVIYTGIRHTPAQIAQIALEEDIDIVGLSILSGAHIKLSEKVLQELGKREINDRPVILGGVIPHSDIEKLKEMGIAGIFRPGIPIKEIITFIENKINKH